MPGVIILLMQKYVSNENETKDFGEFIGRLLCGGEIIELIGDVGAGKTTFVKGVAIGLDIDEQIQSPSFTISRTYNCRDNLILNHYDFYRLNDAGIMINDLQESISDSSVVTIIEWGKLIEGVLPDDRLTIEIITDSEKSRILKIRSGGQDSEKLKEKLHDIID